LLETQLPEAITNTRSKYSRCQPVDWFHHAQQHTISLLLSGSASARVC